MATSSAFVAMLTMPAPAAARRRSVAGDIARDGDGARSSALGGARIVRRVGAERVGRRRPLERRRRPSATATATATAACGGGATPSPRVSAPPRTPTPTPTPTPTLSRAAARDVRAHAWLGDWLKENLGDGDDAKGAKGAAGGSKKTRGGGAKKGLDPELFKDSAPSRGKRTTGGAKSSGKPRAPGRRDRPPADRPPDRLSPEELRPDFGLRRDLYDLYDVKSLDDEEPIGAGSYGIVRKVTRRSDGKKFALKTIRKAPWRQPPTSRTSVQYYHSKLRNELEVMRKIGSSLSIVYLYDSFEDGDAVHLLMDLCTGGELLGRMRAGINYSERDAAELVRSVVRTAAQCHSRGIIFRDIKPDNFLFDNEALDSPLKATDFGLAGLITPGEKLTRRCGTPSYMAPEVINRNYGEEADVWSCGVVAYQLLTGRLPFVDKVNQRPNAKEVFRAILDDQIDFVADPWPRLSPECVDLVRKMLDRDPETRITARAALLHPWLLAPTSEEALSGATQPIGGQVVARLQRFSTYGLLKRSVLRLLGDQLRKDDPNAGPGVEGVIDGVLAEERNLTKEFLELFQLLDTSGDDLVEPDELQAGLMRVGYDITQDECEQLLDSLDTTNDGCIDVDEFLAALVDWEALERSSEAYPSWVKEAFNMLDKDGNGTIDAGEVAELVFMNEDDGKLTSEAKKVIAACISEADTDGDGLIDLDEFITLLQMDPTDRLDAYELRLSKRGGSVDLSADETVLVD